MFIADTCMEEKRGSNESAFTVMHVHPFLLFVAYGMLHKLMAKKKRSKRNGTTIALTSRRCVVSCMYIAFQ
jgi:hypothetical protein